MLNLSTEKNSSGSFVGDNLVHAFPKGISPKVSVIGQLESELAYYGVAIQHISHDVKGMPLLEFLIPSVTDTKSYISL